MRIEVVVAMTVLVGGACGPPRSGDADALMVRQREVLQRFTGIWTADDVTVYRSVFRPDFVRHASAASRTRVEGPDAMFEMIQRFQRAYSDLSITLEEVVQRPDTAVVRWTIEAVHSGPGFIPPTGRTITISGMSILHFADDQVLEEWAVSDNLDLYQQLGFTLSAPQ